MDSGELSMFGRSDSSFQGKGHKKVFLVGKNEPILGYA